MTIETSFMVQCCNVNPNFTAGIRDELDLPARTYREVEEKKDGLIRWGHWLGPMWPDFLLQAWPLNSVLSFSMAVKQCTVRELFSWEVCG